MRQFGWYQSMGCAVQLFLLVRVQVFSLGAGVGAGVGGSVTWTPSTHASMRHPENFLTVSALSIVTFTICYMTVGVLGGVRYAGDIKSQLSLNLNIPQGRDFEDITADLNCVAIVLFCINLVPTYAVVYFIAYQAVELQILRRLGMERHSTGHKALKHRLVMARWVFVLISGVIALYIPDFGDYIGLIGALATSLAIYVLPHICWLKECRHGSNMGRTVLSVLVVVFGCVLAALGTQQSVAGMLRPVHH